MTLSRQHGFYPLLPEAPRLLPSALLGSGLGLLLAATTVGPMLHRGSSCSTPPPAPIAPPTPHQTIAQPQKSVQPVAVFQARSKAGTAIDYLIERPDGSRVVGTSGVKTLIGYSKLLGISPVFLPDWLPGQPYKPNDLRLSGGMAGGQPALNMAGTYQVRVGLYNPTDAPIAYSYTITCRIAACNGTVLYSKSGIAQPGPAQEAGSFTLPPFQPDTPPPSAAVQEGRGVDTAKGGI